MVKQTLSLKTPLPEGVLARLALRQIRHSETGRVVEGPFPTRQAPRRNAPVRTAKPAQEPKMHARSSEVMERLLREAEVLEKRRAVQQEREFEASLRRDVEDDLEPRFRVRLNDRAGADYRDCDCWWLGRYYTRPRNGGDNGWKCHRSTKWRRSAFIDYMR